MSNSITYIIRIMCLNQIMLSYFYHSMRFFRYCLIWKEIKYDNSLTQLIHIKTVSFHLHVSHNYLKLKREENPVWWRDIRCLTQEHSTSFNTTKSKWTNLESEQRSRSKIHMLYVKCTDVNTDASLSNFKSLIYTKKYNIYKLAIKGYNFN